MIIKGNCNKVLLGPWVGEFGWELFKWQGWCREYSNKNPTKHITCCAIKGREYLYSDFSPVIHTMENVDVSQACMYYNNSKDVQGKVSTIVNTYKKNGYHIITPFDIGKESQKFLLMGNDINIDSSINYIIHARHRTHRSDDNYSVESWNHIVNEIINMGCSVASIGSTSDSLHINGSVDMRGIPLSKLIGVISNSLMVIGPSSGPIHLASLCNKAHLVWSGNIKNKIRYDSEWNPFNTKCFFINENQPSPELIVNIIREDKIICMIQKNTLQKRCKKEGHQYVSRGGRDQNFYIYQAKAFADEIIKKKRNKCLDYGCGVGRLYPHVNNMHNNYFGVDIVCESIKYAKFQYGENNFYLLDENGKIPTNGEMYDAVIIITVLQHIPDSQIHGVLNNIKNVLKSGCDITIIDTDENTSALHVFKRTPEFFIKHLNIDPDSVEVKKIVVDFDKIPSHWVLRGKIHE